jgi:hypothetical protein
MRCRFCGETIELPAHYIDIRIYSTVVRVIKIGEIVIGFELVLDLYRWRMLIEWMFLRSTLVENET